MPRNSSHFSTSLPSMRGLALFIISLSSPSDFCSPMDSIVLFRSSSDMASSPSSAWSIMSKHSLNSSFWVSVSWLTRRLLLYTSLLSPHLGLVLTMCSKHRAAILTSLNFWRRGRISMPFSRSVMGASADPLVCDPRAADFTCSDFPKSSAPYLASTSSKTSFWTLPSPLPLSTQLAGMSACLNVKHLVVSSPATARIEAARGSPVISERSPKKLPTPRRFITLPM
mmetsp:Transcript_11574/g.23065  ORF Transcript_11574/g.23065 Transcript_11574/m.23065 type:complete len:226 (+) Transcript_11574:254-931(+)